MMTLKVAFTHGIVDATFDGTTLTYTVATDDGSSTDVMTGTKEILFFLLNTQGILAEFVLEAPHLTPGMEEALNTMSDFHDQVSRALVPEAAIMLAENSFGTVNRRSHQA